MKARDRFFKACPHTTDSARWFKLLREGPYAFATWHTAYNFATGKPYRGRNVTKLCAMTRARNLVAAVYLTRAQLHDMGGHLADDTDQAQVRLLKDVTFNPGTDAERSVFINRAFIVYHYEQITGVSEAQLARKLRRIERLEMAEQFTRAVPTFRKYWPHTDLPMPMWPADMFYRQALWTNAYHALVTSIELCREARVTWTTPVHPSTDACLNALRRPAHDDQFLQIRLYQWTRPVPH